MTPLTPLPNRFARSETQRFLKRLGRNDLPTGPGTHTDPYGIPARHEDQVRLLTLNLAHGRRRGPHQVLQPGKRLRRNLDRVAQALFETAPDVVALQEADGPSAWSGNFDHVATLAELLELPHHYRGDHSHPGFARLNLEYGTALLSKHPLDKEESHRFGQNWRDTKGFVVATVKVPQWSDAEIDVVSIHLDFLVPRTRRRQIATLVERLRERRHPLVLLGDLNACWTQEPKTMALITEQLGLHAHEPDSHKPTFPAIRPVRRLDWILISRELAFGHSHFTLPHWVSDHLPVVADLEQK